MRCWILLVTHGTIVEYPPEIYRSRTSAVREARRWSEVLSGYGQISIEHPFEGRWEIGDRDVRLVPSGDDRTGGRPFEPPWIGVHWTIDGYPDPEALMLKDRTAARRWVLQPTDSLGPRDVEEGEWTISASFGSAADESYSVAHLAKIVEWPEAATADVGYDVELTGTFVHWLKGVVSGPPGLTRAALETRIEESWAELSSTSGVLLESSWTLESFREEKH